MIQQLAGYLIPPSFQRFQWHRYSGQNDASETYIYLISPPVNRLQEQSSVLYIGKNEQPISKRFGQEMRTRNTPGNSQAPNIRMSFISQLLLGRGDKIDLYFTYGLSFFLSGKEPKILDLLCKHGTNHTFSNLTSSIVAEKLTCQSKNIC